jgi:diacylglycerol kinase (ATP)
MLSNSLCEQQQQQQTIGPGHFFSKKTFHKPTYCHHCTEMLWGLIGQGFTCEGLPLSIKKHLQMGIV